MKKIKISVIGFAEIAENRILPAIMEHPLFELISISNKPNAKIAQHSDPVIKAEAALSILILCSKAMNAYPTINIININK